MASRSKSAAAAFTSVIAVLSCILEPPGYAISGKISGAQAHQVTVSLSGAALGADRTTKTDSSGAYSFDGLPKGSYTITPSLAGYHFNPASAPATVAERDVAAMDFDGRLDDNQPADPLALQVWGRDMGSLYQNVSVVQQGVRVNDAAVNVNGVTIPHPPTWYEAGDYIGQLAAPVPTGGQIVMEVTRGGKMVTAVGKVPEAPLLTGPPDGAKFAPDRDVAVTWTSSTQPDHFTVNAQWSCGSNCGTGTRFNAPGSARAFSIPAQSLPSGMAIQISVFAYNDGTFSGDYAPWPDYPGMNIRAEWNAVTISR
jgi:carboxypeptidase family protein